MLSIVILKECGEAQKIMPMHSKKKLKGQVHVLTYVNPKEEEGDHKRKCKSRKAALAGYLRPSVACQMWHADSLI
jgi:hypothetical protein